MPSNVQEPGSSTPEQRSIIDTLLQAAQSIQQQRKGDRPFPKTLVSALVLMEKTCKQDRIAYPAQALLGTWRFSFAANRTSRETAEGIQGSGFYVPGWVKANIVFASSDQWAENAEAVPTIMTVTNSLQLGSILLTLRGAAKYLNRKNLLAFDFHYMEIALFGQRLYSGSFPGRQSQEDSFVQQPISKLPFFAFIAIADQYIAARGRGGGLALWVKE